MCESAALAGIGITYASTGQPRLALDYLGSALEIAQAIGYREGEAETLVEYGNALCGLGRFEDALRTQQEALSVVDELSDRHMEARAHEGAALATLGRGDSPAARAYLGKARSIYADLGVPEADTVLSLVRDLDSPPDGHADACE